MDQDTVIEAFSHVVKSRRSVRAFLPRRVEQQTLNAIFELAQTAPSNCNTQPWIAHVVSGEICQQLKQELTSALMRGEFSMDFPYEGKYQGVYRERQVDAANQLYTAMGIAREDKVARNAAFLRNFSFFDAPHAVFLFLPEGFGLREAADVGMYAQNLMLAMTAYGLGSCPQTALGFHAGVVREALSIPDEMKLLFGISFGYEDAANAANKTRINREPIEKAVFFHG